MMETSMSRIRTPLVVAACLGLLGGVALASFAITVAWIPSWWFTVAVTALAVVGVRALPSRVRSIAIVAVIACGLGALRLTIAMHLGTHPAMLPADRTTVELQGRVIEAAPRRGGAIALRLIAAQTVASHSSDGQSIAFRRHIVVTLPPSAPETSYGDTIRVRCRFLHPQRTADALTTDGRCIVWDPRDLRRVATGGGSPTIRALLTFRDVAVRRIRDALPEPAAGVAAGMVLGERRSVSDDLEAAFRRSGTIHLLVVSGWHMTFIAYLIRKVLGWLLAWFGIARRTVIHLTIAAIIAFTVMVGLSAPAIRGALVAIAIQAVDLLGRIGNPIRTLLLVATTMVAVHPHVLGFDLGFQLTVAATTAILFILPAVDRVLPCRDSLLRDLRDLTAASAAASFATAPLLAASFGTVAVLGALASIPILPISAAVMVVGLALLAATALAPGLIASFVWALTSLTNAIVLAVERIAAVPWATIPIGRPDAWFIAALYLLILAAIIRWYQRRDIPLLAPLPRR